MDDEIEHYIAAHSPPRSPSHPGGSGALVDRDAYVPGSYEAHPQP